MATSSPGDLETPGLEFPVYGPGVGGADRPGLGPGSYAGLPLPPSGTPGTSTFPGQPVAPAPGAGTTPPPGGASAEVPSPSDPYPVQPGFEQPIIPGVPGGGEPYRPPDPVDESLPDPVLPDTNYYQLNPPLLPPWIFPEVYGPPSRDMGQPSREPFPRRFEQAFCEMFPFACVPMPAVPAPAPAPPRPRGRRGRGGRAPAPPAAPPAPQPPTGSRVLRPPDIPVPRMDAPVFTPPTFPPNFPLPPTFPSGPPIPRASPTTPGPQTVTPVPQLPPMTVPSTPPASSPTTSSPPISIPAPSVPAPVSSTSSPGTAARIGIGILIGVIGDLFGRPRRITVPGTFPGVGNVPATDVPAIPAPGVGVAPAPIPLTGFNTAALPYAATQARTRRCRCPKCKQKKRKKARPCLARAPLVWAGGPKKGKPAGTRCIRFSLKGELEKAAGKVGRKVGRKALKLIKGGKR